MNSTMAVVLFAKREEHPACFSLFLKREINKIPMNYKKIIFWEKFEVDYEEFDVFDSLGVQYNLSDPYENQQIGRFIYRLGIKVGIRAVEKKEEPANMLLSSVELLQQHPPDKSFGDLMALIDGLSFVIEFKRNYEAIGQNKGGGVSEIDKLQMLRDGIDNDEDDLEDISRRCHFLAYGETDENGESRIKLRRYLLMRDDRFDAFDSDDFLDGILNDGVIERKTSKPAQIGFTGKKFDRYLGLLNETWGSHRSSEALARTPALLLGVYPNSDMFYLQESDILRLSNRYFALKRGMEMKIARQIQHEIEPDEEHTRKHTMGRSMFWGR